MHNTLLFSDIHEFLRVAKEISKSNFELFMSLIKFLLNLTAVLEPLVFAFVFYFMKFGDKRFIGFHELEIFLICLFLHHILVSFQSQTVYLDINLTAELIEELLCLFASNTPAFLL